jgi:hypothetical protein
MTLDECQNYVKRDVCSCRTFLRRFPFGELPSVFVVEVSCKAYLADGKARDPDISRSPDAPRRGLGKGKTRKVCETCGQEFIGGPRAKLCEGCRKTRVGKNMPVTIKHKDPLPASEPGDPGEYARKQIEETKRVHDAALRRGKPRSGEN